MSYEVISGKRHFTVGQYLVIEEKKTMVCVYLKRDGYSYESRKLLTSRGNWKSAVKLARLLEKTYEMGRKDEEEDTRWRGYW